jgi:hypothetical protein
MLLPSLHKLSLAPGTGMAPKKRRMIPRSVWLNLPRCYFATFSDDEVLVLEINYYTNEYNEDVVSFNLRSAGMFSFEIPIGISKDTTRIFANDEPGFHAWKTAGDIRRMVGRYIVAFAAIIRQMHPQIEEVRYHNTAVIDDMDATDADHDEDKLRVVAEDALYRVRYYERLGFEFDVPYADQVQGVIEELTDQPVLEDILDVAFSGELLSMADTLPQTFPDECTLVRLHTDVCE